MYGYLKTTLEPKYAPAVHAAELRHAYYLACALAAEGNLEAARPLGQYCIRKRAHNPHVSGVKLLRLFLRLYVPGANRISMTRGQSRA